MAADLDTLWEDYLAAAADSASKERTWRMMRQAAKATGQGGLIFQQFYEADQAAHQAYEAWRAAFRTVNPGVRG